mgnify:CR=1 FL=1
MPACLIAMATAVMIFLFPLQPSRAEMIESQPNLTQGNLSLPAALADDETFDDLPFEQLRQALREEVERGPNKGISPRSFKRYNLLIR